MADYWNHNTAYHQWLVSIAAQHHGDVLDVGCGDGLLAQRFAPVSRSVLAIDPDPRAVQRGRDRLATEHHVNVEQVDLDHYDPGDRRFDLITFVASVHHLDLRSALLTARRLLRPSGEIAIVGISAKNTVREWLWAAACLPAVKIGSRLHREVSDVGVVVTEPRESLDDIRRVTDDVLPGARIRRALYYRYLLRWQNG